VKKEIEIEKKKKIIITIIKPLKVSFINPEEIIKQYLFKKHALEWEITFYKLNNIVLKNIANSRLK